MTAKPTKPEPAPGSAEDAAAAAKPRWWRRLWPKRWLPVVLVLSFVAHGVLWLCWRSSATTSQAIPAEISLGKYHFLNAERTARLAEVRFDIHVSLLRGTERAGNERLAERKFLVQQGIEELLRQAHAADFDDPTLSELKRQIQEKVNEALEMRTVEAVIITDLAVAERPVTERPVATTTEAPQPAVGLFQQSVPAAQPATIAGEASAG